MTDARYCETFPSPTSHFLRAMRADPDNRDIRGNVDTRLATLQPGTDNAIIRAAAGLSRLNLLHHVTQFVPLD